MRSRADLASSSLSSCWPRTEPVSTQVCSVAKLACFTWLLTSLTGREAGQKLFLYYFPRAHPEGTSVFPALVSLSLLSHTGVSPAPWHRAHVSSNEPLRRKPETGSEHSTPSLCLGPPHHLTSQSQAWTWENEAGTRPGFCPTSPLLCPLSFPSSPRASLFASLCCHCHHWGYKDRAWHIIRLAERLWTNRPLFYVNIF